MKKKWKKEKIQKDKVTLGKIYNSDLVKEKFICVRFIEKNC